MNAVQELARLYGVANAYVDYRAQPREVSLQSQAAILAAIVISVASESEALGPTIERMTVLAIGINRRYKIKTACYRVMGL